MSLFFNRRLRLVIAFLPKSKGLLISWLQLPSAVILEPKDIKSATVSTFSPSICHKVMGPDATFLAFWMLSFKPDSHSPLSPSSRGSLFLFTFCPRAGHGNLLQYSCLENLHGQRNLVAKGNTIEQLSTHTHTHTHTHLHVWGCCYFSQQSWFQLVIHPAWHFARCTLHIS